MERPIIVVIEGESFALSLCDYLTRFHGFCGAQYDGKSNLNGFLIHGISEGFWKRPRIVIARCHLTALANGHATVAQFQHVDQTLAGLGAKLVLAVGRKDSTGLLADGYAHSHLEKRVHPKAAPVTHLLHWLGLRGSECSSSTYTGMTRSRSTMASAPRSKRRATPES